MVYLKMFFWGSSGSLVSGYTGERDVVSRSVDKPLDHSRFFFLAGNRRKTEFHIGFADFQDNLKNSVVFPIAVRFPVEPDFIDIDARSLERMAVVVRFETDAVG